MQHILKLARQIPECDAVTDDQLMAMLEGLDLEGVNDDTLSDTNALIGKYAGDPAWDKFISAVLAGPDFQSQLSAEQQFTALVKALPKTEEEAGKQLEAQILG